MKTLQYTIQFHTPAFLGNAVQNGQWRTPPFKALLRQWWRVAAAAHSCDLIKLREREGRLFGHAWLQDDRVGGRNVTARKSAVRLRLSSWNEGQLKNWEGLEQKTVEHPEAEKTNCQIGPHAYLGYGPLIVKGRTTLKSNAAIQFGEAAKFSLAVPEVEWPLIQQALWLIDRFGTVGGRSRNGWGSFHLSPIDGTPPLQGTLPLRNWRECLTLDWPHALGQDEHGALIWQTPAFDDWKVLMRELAIIKIGLRTQFPFTTGKNAQISESRHFLSYPVTNHSVQAWGNNARLPNSLRFKVRPDAGNPDKVRGIIFHVPCLPPPAFNPDKQAIVQVWQKVHSHLSQHQHLTRVQES
jgi:CRISPR-associated protein Cmr1